MRSRQHVLILLFLLFTLSGIVASYFIRQPVSTETVAEDVQKNLIHVLDRLSTQADEQLKRIGEGRSLALSETQFLLINDEKILEWSSHRFIPSFYLLAGSYDIKYIRVSSGDYIVKRIPVDSIRGLVAIVPLHIAYRISNDYLKPYWNPDIFKEANVVILLPELNDGIPVSVNGKIIFKIATLQQQGENPVARVWVLVSFFSAIFVLLLLLSGLIRRLAQTKPVAGFFVLTFSLLFIRAIMIGFRFPARFDTLLLFDAKDFASSQFNPSLGDMALNAVVVFVLCLYLKKYYTRFVFLHRGSWVVTIISALAIFYGMLYPAIVVQTLYNNSEISLGISQSLDFSLLRITAFILLIISWISSFLFIHVALKLLTQNENIRQISISILAGFLVFILINEVTGQPYLMPALAAIVYLVGTVSFRVYNTLDRFQLTTFVYIFLALICFSFIGAINISFFESHRKAENQQRFAHNFLIERDYFGEYLMGEAADKIANDVFIQNRLNNPLLDKEAIRHKIEQVSLSGYFNRYTVSVRLFDQAGTPLPGEPDTVNYTILAKRFRQAEFKTAHDKVFYITDNEDRTLKKYVIQVPVKRRGNSIGYVLVELTLKRVIPDNVYPELLVDTRFQQSYQPRELNYAIISNAQIEYSTGNYNYEPLIANEIRNPELYIFGILRNKYLHVGVEDVNGRVAIVSSPAIPVMYHVADFSFLVLLGISAVFFYLLSEGIIHYTRAKSLYFSARIQLILNLAFFVPLVAVCIITLGLTAKSSREQLKDDFLTRTTQFAKAVSLAPGDSTNHERFENEFKNAVVLSGLDANLYATDGMLLATSQPLIFETQMHSAYLDPGVFRRMRRGETSFVSTDQIGSLEFYVAYSKILSADTGEMLGILGVPFFQSEESLKQMQTTVLANIISIFTLVFIVLLVVSFFVTKWLTAPLTMITQTFGRISLTRTNQPLKWKSDDEIGLMVREYNHMLDTLSHSKRELEKNQREEAWREIAQQVAHEIKNPLTPMKLTLQQLERSLGQNDKRDEKLEKAVASLLSQINSLDDLASSFSSFAKMPEPVMKPIDLITLVNRVVNLHAQESTIVLETRLETAPIFADDQLLGRILSNIILNGIQAVPAGTTSHLTVTVMEQGSYFTVFIKDNGSGIEQDLIDKIFLPHFTTKKAGSGLGLAIARQGIEQMGGRITFETSGKGTTFRIDLPQNN